MDAAEAVKHGMARLNEAADAEEREKSRLREKLPWISMLRAAHPVVERPHRGRGHRQRQGDDGRDSEGREHEPVDRADVEKAQERPAAEIGDDERDRAAEAHPAVVQAEAADAGQCQRLGDRQRQRPQCEGRAGDDEERHIAVGSREPAEKSPQPAT